MDTYMEKKEPTRDKIIETLKELDVQSQKPIGRKALQAKGINQYWIQKLIPEGLTKLKQQLGLKISTQERPLSDDELFKKIDDAVSNSKRITWAQLRRETGITDKVFNQRFGKKGIFGVISHYRKWLEEHQPESKNIELVDAYLEDRGKTKNRKSQLVKTDTSTTTTQWVKGAGPEYGATLNFRNLIYEPTTHDCVVFLFGMVSKELGFSIEYIGKEFPDCIAKRSIKGRGGRQQPVRIEFELKSRDYDHPPEGCDVIVCWENNWKDNFPIEVIELRTEIKRLPK